jgi:hypothetical protein
MNAWKNLTEQSTGNRRYLGLYRPVVEFKETDQGPAKTGDLFAHEFILFATLKVNFFANAAQKADARRAAENLIKATLYADVAKELPSLYYALTSGCIEEAIEVADRIGAAVSP